MKTLRRYNLKNQYYFVTIATYKREDIILADPDLIWQLWPLATPTAWVLMPDHLHLLFNIANKNISDVIHNFKIGFSRKFRDSYRPGRVWQNRFWDHIIRDQNDFTRHFDYIHYNPVKHGMVRRPFDWNYSSIHDYSDFYSIDWGVKGNFDFTGTYGE